MRLTLMTDYALRLLMHLAQHPDRLCTISEIADTFSISETHLMKITHRLGLLGWIETVRGKGGGMKLAIAPAKLNLGELVRSMEADLAIVECLGSDNHCTLSPDCRLSGIMQGALNSFLSHLDGFSLADVLPDTTPRGAARTRVVTLRRLRRTPA